MINKILFKIKKNIISYKLLPQCLVSVPFYYNLNKTKFIICFTLVDGFFDLYIIGQIKKITLQNIIFFKTFEKLWYCFKQTIPFLLIFNYV